MATNLFTGAKFRAFDSSGNPLSGGLLYAYVAGTTTAQDTYTTRAGTIANTNPVVLDANGEADVWLTPSVNYKFVLKNSLGVTQWTEDNIPSSSASDTTGDVTTEPGGRLSLTTGTPVTTSDVTGATTIYYTAFKHGRVPLYDGASWSLASIGTEISQTTTDATKSPTAATTSSNYDMFVWDDAGTVRLSRGPAWASDTGRGTGATTTELERVDGRYVNKVSIANGPAAQRGLYVGTIRTDASSQVNDSLAKRHVWNAYGRVSRGMKGATETTDSWAYTTFAYRQANANAANQLDYVAGLSTDAVDVTVLGWASTSGAANFGVGIGVDSTTVNSAGVRIMAQPGAGVLAPVSARYIGCPGLGRHALVWLESSVATGTTTWNGDAGNAQHQSGILGTCWA